RTVFRRFDMRLLALGTALIAALATSALPALAQSAPTCAGRSIVDELRGRDPAALEAAMQRARTIWPNMGARLWRIERAGVAPSLLLGTMHAGDSRVRPLPAVLQEALPRARVLALELREIGLDAATQQQM